MSAETSVTEWIAKVKAGDEDAARKLWEHYFEKLVKQARKTLRSAHRRTADEEDAVLSAMACFFRRAKEGKFKELHDRNDLWRLLVKITRNKTIDHIRRSPREAGESKLGRRAAPDQPLPGLDAREDDKSAFPFDPTTMVELSEADALAEFVSRLGLASQELLDKLGDKKLRQVALLRMQGCTLKEIAKKIDCVISTVEFKLMRIKEVWSKEITP
jgi:RNA polymerase sigma factor (sigma-70 family)